MMYTLRANVMSDQLSVRHEESVESLTLFVGQILHVRFLAIHCVHGETFVQNDIGVKRRLVSRINDLIRKTRLV